LTKGFISYAHEDHRAFEEICAHVTALERCFDLDFWRDKRIVAGNYWTSKIADAIEEASIHLLLFTPRFIASEYIAHHELPAINAKYGRGDLVLPVIVKRCMWQPFVGVLQAAPMTPQGRLQPVVEWKPQGNGYDAAREQLSDAIAAYLGKRPSPPFSWTGKP
jgi:hypothetical protein